MATSPRNILYFANTDWYLYNFRSALIRSAAEAGYQVHSVSPPGPFGPRLQKSGIEWRSLPFSRGSRSGMALSLWRTRQTLRRTILEIRPALIHSFTLTSILLTWLACPARQEIVRVNAVTGLGFAFTGQSTAHRSLQAVLRLFLRRALSGKGAITIVQNPTDKAFLIDRLGLPRDSVYLIAGSGVDTRRFVPRPRGGDGPVRVGFVGRLLEDKGIREFVAAARRLAGSSPPVEFLAAGTLDSGNPASIGESELAQWKLEGHVRFVGQIEDMPAFLSELDVFVLPSYREGLSRSLIEAGACGLPSVTTDVPGCRDVVNDGHNGLLVPPQDSNSLASAIQKLLVNQELRRRMGTVARATVVQHFSKEVINKQMLGLYDQLMKNQSSDQTSRERN